jgi:hypothetical protein
MRARWRLAAAALVGAAACGGNVVVEGGQTGLGGQTGSGGQAGSQGNGGGLLSVSCDVSFGIGMHICEEYDFPPSPTMSVASFEAACMGEPGTVVTMCPSANRWGTCTVSVDSLIEKKSYYSGDMGSAAEDQMGCTAAGGTWTSG